MCFVVVSEKNSDFALHNIHRYVFITPMISVYCAVRIESSTDYVSTLRVVFCSEGPRSRRYGRTAALRLLVQPCDEDDDDYDDDFLSFS
jgi:hypothetical protein